MNPNELERRLAELGNRAHEMDAISTLIKSVINPADRALCEAMSEAMVGMVAEKMKMAQAPALVAAVVSFSVGSFAMKKISEEAGRIRERK